MPNHLRKYQQFYIAALMLVLAGSACVISLPLSVNPTGGQPVQVTQEVTRLVTQDVTREVTRVIELPVIVTSSVPSLDTATPAQAPTADGTSPVTSALPVVSIQEYSDCLYGPASFYLYKTSLLAGSLMEVAGRNLDGTWLDVEEVGGWDPCWIEASRVKFNTGDIQSVPVAFSVLPLSTQYHPPDAIARRNGSEVTVSWKAVWMSFDDYRGYLIEAWVCQGGNHIFLPVSYVPPLESNTGNLSVKITDEPGCAAPSSARIYSADKYGYSTWQIIFWPPN